MKNLLGGKKILMIGVAVILLLIGGIYVLNSNKQKKVEKPKENLQTEVIPTVDATVTVDLELPSGSHEVGLSIDGVPAGTQTVDYELSYNTQEQGLQGVIGTAKVEGEKNYRKDITLGTCSSGKCVYHEVVGAIKLSLRFNGDYGTKIFEREYSL